MNAVKSLAAYSVIAIAIVTLIVDFIFHHHLGAEIFTGVAYFALAVVVFFDLSTTPKANSHFCQSLTPNEIQTFRLHHVALLYPGAAHFYAGALTAFTTVGALWAIAAFMDGGYVTGSLLVLYFFLTAIENSRVTPQQHTDKSASAGNIVAIQRRLHWQSINEKLAAHAENTPAVGDSPRPPERPARAGRLVTLGGRSSQMITKSQLEWQQRKKERQTEKILVAVEYNRHWNSELDSYILDSSILPLPKHELIDALLFSAANVSKKTGCESLIMSTVSLAHFQEGVGDEPIYLAQVESIAKFDVAVERSIHSRMSGKEVVRFVKQMNAEIRQMVPWIEKARAANLHLRPAHKKLWDRLMKNGLHSPFYDGYVDFNYSQEVAESTYNPA